MASTIEINGKTYPVRWGLSVMQTFCDKTKIPLDDIVTDMFGCLSKNLLFKVDLLFEAIKYGCKREKVELDITWDDVEAWFSDNPGFSQAFVEAWNSQLPPVSDDKKKVENPESEQ